ncbi:MAG: hypothetical protein HZB87_09330 [Desulfatitalea sp.]|nr:hypothetical protein [Desulfatitalea sp.]
MPYDANKDEVLKQWHCEETGLMVSIQRYDGGEAKVQIGPRILKRKDGNERAPAKAGRLTIEDMLWFYSIIDEVKEELSNLVGPE